MSTTAVRAGRTGHKGPPCVGGQCSSGLSGAWARNGTLGEWLVTCDDLEGNCLQRKTPPPWNCIQSRGALCIKDNAHAGPPSYPRDGCSAVIPSCAARRLPNAQEKPSFSWCRNTCCQSAGEAKRNSAFGPSSWNAEPAKNTGAWPTDTDNRVVVPWGGGDEGWVEVGKGLGRGRGSVDVCNSVNNKNKVKEKL